MSSYRLFLFLLLLVTVQLSLGADLPVFHNFRAEKLKFGWSVPKQVAVGSGGNAMMFMTPQLSEVTRCLLTHPDGKTIYDLLSSNPIADERIQLWHPDGTGGQCGAYIKKITQRDVGRWRLLAMGKDNVLKQGFSTVTYVDLENASPAAEIELAESPQEQTIYFNRNRPVDYCEISAPILGTIWSRNCSLHLSKVTKGLEGNWNVKIGHEGTIEETDLKSVAKIYGIEIATEQKALRGSSKALSCLIANATDVQVTFCRFHRLSDSKSFHLVEGLGNDGYRYYGRGLGHKECGIAIESPGYLDQGTWECTLGYYVPETKTNGTITSYVTFDQSPGGRNPTRKESGKPRDASDDAEILGGAGNPLEVTCFAEVRLKYCWFRTPQGIVINPPLLSETGGVRDVSAASGGHLLTGKCTVLVEEAQMDHAGTWTCHMGPLDRSQMDLVAEVQVRISEGPLAAVQKKVQVQLGSAATLRCRSVSLEKVQRFCRFTLPDGSALGLDEGVGENKAINDLYWYGGRSLITGECYLNIKRVQEEHLGVWNCTAAIGSEVGTDTITVIGAPGLSVAAISGIVVGAVAIVIVVGVVIKCAARKESPQRSLEENINLDSMERRSNASSNNSEDIEFYNVQLNQCN